MEIYFRHIQREGTSRNLWTMKNKLFLAKGFTKFEAEGDVTGLLQEIRRASFKIETNTSVYDAIDEAKSVYYTHR